MKKRLDNLLVEKNLYENRTRAQAVILAGRILVNGQKIDKAGALVKEESEIRILGEDMPYVSRGGLKLEKALDEFQIDPKDRICLDIGASTGGFTDCLLKRGAAKVYAVDVGYGQLDLKVRNNPSVVAIERTNARYLTPKILYGDDFKLSDLATLSVIDVSFISLSKIFPAVFGLMAKDGEAIALVKPQFEAGREQVGKGGIVKDAKVHEEVLNKIKAYAEESGFVFLKWIPSPIKGADGNIEFLAHLRKD